MSDDERMSQHTETDTRVLLGTRSYNYDSTSLQGLFASIITSLSCPHDSEEVITRILVDICLYFKFGCGFVYQTDHTDTYHLKEKFAVFNDSQLPNSFRLQDHLSKTEITEIERSTVFYFRHGAAEVHAANKLFRSNTLILVPALGKNGESMGLIGLMDRRKNILLDQQAVDAAKMVLDLVANYLKIRIYQQNLALAEQSLVSILDNTGVDIYVNDFNTHEILYANKSMAAPYGGREAMLGKRCWQTLYTDKSGPCEYCPQNMLADEDGNPTKIYSWDYRRPFDGSWFRVLSAAFSWVDGRLAHVVSSIDITEHKNSEATIAQMANYDALTNLPNRRKLFKDTHDAIKNHSGEKAVYLLFFDLDDFKKLNDSMGHLAGDELLTTVGNELRKNPLTQNHSYRYGGDEFIVLLDDATRDEAREVVRFLLRRFNQPWELTNAMPICRASIGVAEYPANADSPDLLLHHADAMMYRAKQNGPGIACFHDGEVIRHLDA